MKHWQRACHAVLAQHHYKLYGVVDNDFFNVKEYIFLCGFLERYDFETYFELVKDTPSIKILINTKRSLEIKRNYYQRNIDNIRKKINYVNQNYSKIKQSKSISNIQVEAIRNQSYESREMLKTQLLSHMNDMLRSIEDNITAMEYEIESETKNHFDHVCDYVRKRRQESSFVYKYTFYFMRIVIEYLQILIVIGNQSSISTMVTSGFSYRKN